MGWTALLAAPLTLAAAATPTFALTDTVEPTLDLDDVLDELQDTPIDEALDAVEDAAEPVTDVVEDTSESLTGIVEDTTKPIRELIDDGGTDPVTDPVDDVAEAITDLVDPGTRPTDDPPDEAGSAVAPGDPGSDAEGDDDAAPAGAQTGERATPADVRLRFPATAPEAGLGSAPPPARSAGPLDSVTAGSAVPAQTAWQRVGRGARDAAGAFSIPLVLAGAVALFLLVQGRIDARDPKLAVAPDDDPLVFT